MSTFTLAKEQASGLAGGVDEVQHRSSIFLQSRDELVLSEGKFSGDETFFPVPAFRSLSTINNSPRYGAITIISICQVYAVSRWVMNSLEAILGLIFFILLHKE